MISISYCLIHHCSPTFTVPFFRPRPPLPPEGVNLAGSNGRRSTDRDLPSKTSSDIAFPQAGAHAMPQQLCPAFMYAPDHPDTFPMYGLASGGQGLIPSEGGIGHRKPMLDSLSPVGMMNYICIAKLSIKHLHAWA